MTIETQAKFKPFGANTTHFIKDKVIPNLNNNLPAMQDATQEQIVVAVSSFLAHGNNFYTVDVEANPLFEEIRNKLAYYGIIVTWDNVKFKLGHGYSSLQFITVDNDVNQPKIDTVYNTRYTDGSYSEVDRGDITLVNGYQAVSWKIVKPELQIAYVAGKQDQPTKQYISLGKENLPTTFLKADKEELQSIHEKIIDIAAVSEGVWKYQDGLISGNLSLIESAVRNALIQVVGRADFKFLAEIKLNNRQNVVETVESIGGSI